MRAAYLLLLIWTLLFVLLFSCWFVAGKLLKRRNFIANRWAQPTLTITATKLYPYSSLSPFLYTYNLSLPPPRPFFFLALNGIYGQWHGIWHISRWWFSTDIACIFVGRYRKTFGAAWFKLSKIWKVNNEITIAEKNVWLSFQEWYHWIL